MQGSSFGYWLKLRRKALDLTQGELANQVGCSAAAIRKIEAEERRPSAQIAQRLAEIFRIPAHERTNFLYFARGQLRSAPAEVVKEFPWQKVARSARTNLPAPVTSLIGREEEIAGVCDYLLREDTRLVTLIGPPGIGKTRLSIEVGRAVLSDFSDGVFFVALAPLEDASLLASTFAQALEYRETKSQPVSKQLVEGIGDKRMLLVLDNCEHLVEYVSGLSASLLSACPHLKILTTSRESLRISGEWLYPIPPLNAPKERFSVTMETASQFPALTLFAERARAVHPNFALHAGNLQVIGSICAHLDGLPLAIELMAARMRLMTPQALLEHMNHQFILSADSMRSLSTRQKTLNNAIVWSYNLLSEEEQRLFAYLSIFSGGFTLESVEAIFSEMFAGISISGLITSLLDKSLLQCTFDAYGEFRFSMLVTIQGFALSCLQSMGNEADVRRAHLSYFLNLAEQADKEIRGPNQVAWIRQLGAESDNLRSALKWAIVTRQTETALQMASHLSLFWFRRSNLSEGRQWLGEVVALPDAPQYPGLYSYALAQLAFHTWLQIGPKEARPSVEQALAIAREHKDTWNTAWALMVLGLVLTFESNFIMAQSMLKESKVLFREVNDEWGYANAVISLGLVAYNQLVASNQDDRVTALTLHEESVFVFRKLGDRYFESVALRFIGTLRIMEPDITRGRAALREALIIAQQLESKYEIAAGLSHIGDAEFVEGNYAPAVKLYVVSRNIFDSIGALQEDYVVNLEKNLTICHAALDEAAFAAAVEQGRSMTIEQAIAYALEKRDE